MKVWQAFVAVQAVLLVVGLIMPINEPLVWYLVANVITAVIAAIVVVWVRRSNRNQPADSD